MRNLRPSDKVHNSQTFFAVYAYLVLYLYQMDFITAFVNLNLKNLILMDHLEGFES